MEIERTINSEFIFINKFLINFNELNYYNDSLTNINLLVSNNLTSRNLKENIKKLSNPIRTISQEKYDEK